MFEVIMLGVALAMDALAVSIANGLKYKNYHIKEMIIASLAFGVFQGLMPALGYLVFSPFVDYVNKYDHWIVFGILLFLGARMIKDSFEEEKNDDKEDEFTFKILIFEAIATAVDALSIGIMLPTFKPNWIVSCVIIGAVTTIICLIGHLLGKEVGKLLKNKATIFGGVILILIGIKTLLEHLGIF